MKFFNLKNEIQNLLTEHVSSSDMFKKNLIKEYLQVWVLEFLYSNFDLPTLMRIKVFCII